jgi:ABC-type Fe3+/spermidine/putrescine transport system ATPase subunit
MDAEVREECFTAVRRAARSRGRIVIFASSDFQQIAAVADDVAVLSGGSVIQTGTPQQVYEEPKTIAVTRLTGECNLLKARRLTSSDEALPEFFTVDGGHRIFAQTTEKNRLGAINQTVTLAIRPEQVAMSMGASFPEDNLLRGVVSAIKFRGATSLVEFDAAGLKVEARVFRIVGLNVGDECMLGLPPHRILILKD